jgi:hypothetical protein
MWMPSTRPGMTIPHLSVRRPRSGKTTIGTADSQGSLPKTATSTYLDDNAVELSLCRGLLPAASL